MKHSSNRYTIFNQAITITYGDVAENHIGNEQIGTKQLKGISYRKLKSIYKNYKNEVEMSLVSLNIEEYDGNVAVLVIKGGVDFLLNDHIADDMYNEHNSLSPDSKYYDTRRSKVLNKHARHNLCFDEEGHDPDYENGLGTVISFNDVDITFRLKNAIENLINIEDLKAEGNYYYDVSKCGIGFHGDTERSIVVGVRLGLSIPLVFQWYYKCSKVGKIFKIDLNHGDIYIMSDKAVGSDWRKKNIYTLRHAAGCDKYTSLSINSIQGKIKNPRTGRMITVGGKLYNQLINEGVLNV